MAGSGVANPSAYFTFNLKVVNHLTTETAADAGFVTLVSAVDVNIFEGDYVRMCIEVRDGAGDDVRLGYQVYDAVVDAGVPGWSEWAYSDWQDPTAAPDTAATGVNAFGSDWKTRWAGGSYMYIENYAAKKYITEFWMDDVIVTPEPATMGLLVLGGVMMLRRKKGS